MGPFNKIDLDLIPRRDGGFTMAQVMKIMDEYERTKTQLHDHGVTYSESCARCRAEVDVQWMSEELQRQGIVPEPEPEEPLVNMGEPMEVYEDWEFEIDSMSVEELLRTWRQQNVGEYVHGAAKTKYLLDRMTEVQRENPAAWDEANRVVTWGNDTFLKPNEL